MKLHEVLPLLTANELRKRLDLSGGTGRLTRKADMVAELERRLLGEGLNAIWGRLSKIERDAVAEAVHHWDGYFVKARFVAKYGSVPSHFASSTAHSWRQKPPPESPLKLLFYQGGIPEDLGTRLASLCDPPPELTITTLDDDGLLAVFPIVAGTEDDDMSHPQRRVDTEALVRHDLPAVLRLIGQGGVGVGPKTGLPGAAAMARIEAVLAGGDWYAPEDDDGIQRWAGGAIRPIRPFAWPLLLQTGGLARLEGSKLALTPRGNKALSQPLGDVVKSLFERWQKKGRPDELRRVDLIKGQTSRGARLTATAERREAINAVLKAICPVGRWIAIDELLRQVRYRDMGFPVAHDLWKLYFLDANYGSLAYMGDAETFQVVDARYLFAYLFEYLATLGLIDVAYGLPYGARPDWGGLWGTDEFLFISRYDGLKYIRINALGAYCLGLASDYRPAEPKRAALLAVDEDLALQTLRKPEPAERMLLERIAQPGSGGRWDLDTAALLEASADEAQRAELHGFLDGAVDGGLPPRLGELLDGLAERAMALADIGPARMIRCRDPGLAARLATDPATAPHCSRAGERLLCVPERKLAAFRKGIAKLGLILPEQTGA